MYFEIENTPEQIRRARKVDRPPKESPKEECARLILAPFCRPPQVVFDNVVIGTTAEKHLEILNPSKNEQQISLGRALPPGLFIHLPGEWLVLEPETCYTLTLQWTPSLPTALRDTIRFTNESQRRFDVIIVLKSMDPQIKLKTKSFKITPGKIKKRTNLKRSPPTIYKKKIQAYQTTKIIQSLDVIKSSVQYKSVKTSNKENISSVLNSYPVQSRPPKCPFDSPCSFFDTSEVFSNVKRHELQLTYDKEETPKKINDSYVVHKNILKPSTKQFIDTNVFDNLSFTPLKSSQKGNEKLNKGPKLILSVESEDSLEMSDKENVTHSIIGINTAPGSSKWSTMVKTNYEAYNVKYLEDPVVQNKKIPNTSSPKETDSLNFTINTDFSRISNDMSFFPQRFSTERKTYPIKIGNENFHDLIDEVDLNGKFSSDTYTKSESPNNVIPSSEYNQVIQPQHSRSSKSRQALFKDFHPIRDVQERNYLNLNRQEANLWHYNRSPSKSITPPPLHSIPEESTQYSETRFFDRSDKKTATFTINSTFDKPNDRSSTSKNSRESWSKKSAKCEPELWKIPIVPPKKSICAKDISVRRDTINKTHDLSCQNNSSNQLGNAFSQSLTIDPFSSLTYFYNEEAVGKFEIEFKKWLNYILTPPADLDSNIEHKADFGKAWIENRNKEIPAAPTKEQVCSKYHNSHRLESLRRSARSLLLDTEISQVLQKLNAQIDKKLIAIRNDRNIHLDVGLQKCIMEVLLSYNPLWLRIGLEAIYSTVIPLKSNSDIEGLTTFIIQRMFKNPFLKNKNTKSNAPNMILPAYVDAMKKYTLKKFFTLVFFLDLAKQKKLIPHDPCLFCRNAVCKESREIVIKFTRELIAGIGDITKHLRPLGYVVFHKQSYLDEYKYAVHNIAIDIRDGVRLTKVMEIILMKSGLLMQLRTPAISRLQKIHNVQVALNALKDTNFVIVGDIAAHDIADGHREKTLSLLWQIIHVFRAPLFENAANVIQTWWRKKLDIIKMQRKIEEEAEQRRHNAAAAIQFWWRRIQYNLLVEFKTQQLTNATVILQKYYRMWICRQHFLKLKRNVLKIEEWWRRIKLIKEAQQTLALLYEERESLRRKSATLIQSNVRRWLCMLKYKTVVQKIICAQSVIRQFLTRTKFHKLKKSVVLIQQRYRALMVMKLEVKKYHQTRQSAIVIQSYYRMYVQRKQYQKYKYAVKTVEKYYEALIKMRVVRKEYLNLKAAICIQKYFRGYMARSHYDTYRKRVIYVQKFWRNKLKARLQRIDFLQKRLLIIKLQSVVRGYLVRKDYVVKRDNLRRIKEEEKINQAATKIQKYCRLWICRRRHLKKLKQAVLNIEEWWRRVNLMKESKKTLALLHEERESLRRKSAILIQSNVRRWLCMRKYKTVVQKIICAQSVVRQFLTRTKFYKLKKSVVLIQQRYKALMVMKLEVQKYHQTRQSAIVIQSYYRMYVQRKQYQKYKCAVKTVEKYYQALVKMRVARNEYLNLKAAICIQKYFRGYMARSQYDTYRKRVIYVQKLWRNKLKTRLQRIDFLQKRLLIIKLQSVVRGYLVRKEYVVKRDNLRRIKEENRIYQAASNIQKYYRMWICRMSFLKLKSNVLKIEEWWRRIKLMKEAQKTLALLYEERESLRRNSATLIQSNVRRWLCMRKYKTVVQKIICTQSVVRQFLTRTKFHKLKKSVVLIQQRYRALMVMKLEVKKYHQTRQSAIVIQSYYRMYVQRKQYQKYKYAVKTVEKYYEALVKMRVARNEYLNLKAAICIQKCFRGYIVRSNYKIYRKHVVYMQKLWKNKLLTRLQRYEFIQKREFIIKLQSVVRGYLVRKEYIAKRENLLRIKEEKRIYWAASKIQALFRAFLVKKKTESETRIVELRRRWREGALKSSQQSMSERNEEVLDVLRNMYTIECVINCFKSLELLTEVYPMMYHDNADWVVNSVHEYLSVTNRSISSVEMLTSAASVLVNLTRYSRTAQRVYDRARINLLLKYMWRFGNSEPHLFCVLSTYLWLFHKYDQIRVDLTKYLNTTDNHKILLSIKGKIERNQRMALNKQKLSKNNGKQMLNHSLRNSTQTLNILPTLEPDYGIIRAKKPRYFHDPEQAIQILFHTYKLYRNEPNKSYNSFCN